MKKNNFAVKFMAIFLTAGVFLLFFSLMVWLITVCVQPVLTYLGLPIIKPQIVACVMATIIFSKMLIAMFVSDNKKK